MMFEVDVIVNVVNGLLFGGGGVDGVIYCVVGFGLFVECCMFGGCDIGDVKFMCGYGLLVCYVIYVVGLVWYGGVCGEVELFVFCYWCVIELVEEVVVMLIVFLVISCGVYCYLVEVVVDIVVGIVVEMFV